MIAGRDSLVVLREPEVVYEDKVLYGVMAEFEEHHQLLRAARRAYAEGYRKMDGYSPFPVEELAEALGHEHNPIPLLTLAGGVVGSAGGYFMQWYAMGRLYPLNVGGRPYHSWPQFIPVTFELTVLVAAVTAFLAVLILNRLPQPHHPVFGVPGFERASVDRFFLCIEGADPKFERVATSKFLMAMEAERVVEVEA